MPRKIIQEIGLVDKTQAGFRSVTSSINKLKFAFGGLAAGISIGGVSAFIKSQADAVDQIGKLSKQIGASTEALSEYRYVADQTGVQFDTLTMAWQRMTRRISQASQGTGEAVEALNELGLSAAKLNQLTPEDQFEAIAKAMESVTNEGDRVRLAFKLFDSEGVRLLRTLDVGAKGMAELRDRARELGLTLTTADTERAALFADTWNTIQNTFKAVFQRVALELLPTFQQLAEYIRNNLVPAVRNFGESFLGWKSHSRTVEELRQSIASMERAVVTTASNMENLREAGQLTEQQEQALTNSINLQTEALADARRQYAILTGDSAALAALAEKQKAKFDALRGSTERQSAANRKLAKTTKDAAASMDVMDRALDLIVDQFNELDAAEARAFAGLNDVVPAVTEKVKEQQSEWSELGQIIGSSFEDAIVKGDKFSDVLKGLEQDIIRLLTRMTVTRPLSTALESSFSDFNIGSLIGDFFSNIFRAKGGPVSANDPYVVGEAGPELFIPKTSGTVIPNDKIDAGIGLGGVVVNVVNNASGVQASARERTDNGTRIIDVMIEQVKSSIAGDISRGAGAIPSALSGTYGLNRVAGAY